MFAFTSVKCRTTFRGLPPGGLMDFQIQGALYHLTGPLQQEGIEPDQFAQLFFYDHDQAADLRCIFNEQHDETFIREFTASLHDTILSSRIINPQKRDFKSQKHL